MPKSHHNNHLIFYCIKILNAILGTTMLQLFSRVYGSQCFSSLPIALLVLLSIYDTVSIITARENLISEFKGNLLPRPNSKHQSIQPEAPGLYFPCSQSHWSSTLLKTSLMIRDKAFSFFLSISNISCSPQGVYQIVRSLWGITVYQLLSGV